MSKDITFNIAVYVEPDGGGFHAFCPALPGLHADGATEREAFRAAGEAAAGYLKSMLKHGEPIPIGMTQVEEEQTCICTPASARFVEQIPVTV